MQTSNRPSKIQLPFASSGTKNTIPVASQIGVTAGAASYTDGFPPLTFTPLASGGVPPAGADFNGILNAITAVQQWQSAGGLFIYDSAWSTANSGYPKGAILQSSDGSTLWLSTADNNTTDPDGATPSGWVSLAAYGITAVSGLTNANVTLSSTQYGKNIITFSGTLTGNVQIIFPTSLREWLVINNTTGNFTLTCKTASGTGIAITRGDSARIYGDGTNILVDSDLGRLINIQIITTTGTYTPTAGMVFVIPKLVGGGGQGGGCPATGASQQSVGSGGSAGSYAEGKFTAAQIGASQTVTIGAGGTGATAGANGNTGGTTSLGALMTAPGGTGGFAGGPFSTASSGVVQSPAQASAPTGANIIGVQGESGSVGLGFSTGASGQGGSTVFGSGATSRATAGSNAGTGYGSGSSGALLGASASATSAVAGQPGVAIIFEYAGT